MNLWSRRIDVPNGRRLRRVTHASIVPGYALDLVAQQPTITVRIESDDARMRYEIALTEQDIVAINLARAQYSEHFEKLKQ